jgi:hypothetical protein
VTADEIRLRNGNVICTLASDYRTLRARTLLLAILDEASFLKDESSRASDLEAARALLPGLATTRGTLVRLDAALDSNRRAITQIASLERRTSRAGKDLIDHPPGGRDDIANVIAGAVHLVLARPRQYEPRVELGLPIVSGGSRVIDLTDEFPQSLATYNWRRSQQG